MKTNFVKILISNVIYFVLILSVEAAEIDNARLVLSLTSEGKLTLSTSGENGTIQIARTSILVGETDSTVFDYTKDAGAVIEAEAVIDPLLSDYELQGLIDNSFSGLPPEVQIGENIYAWETLPFCLLKYTLINQQDSLDARIGWEILPQVGGTFGNETVSWMAFDEILTVSKNNNFIGIKALTQDITSVRSFEYYSGYASDDADLWNWLNYGQYDLIYYAGDDGAVSIPALEPLLVPAGDSLEVWLGVGYGSTEEAMLTAVDLAEEQYILLGIPPESGSHVPAGFSLNQNYPNPFNGQTILSFSIQIRQETVLALYDLRGCKLYNLIDAALQPGKYDVPLSLEELPSGIYFYRLQAGNKSVTRKLHLIK